jgi:hypothetical protein
MALSEGARAGTRTRLSSAGPPAAVFAHALVWLLHAGEMPPVEKKAEEMHVLGAPGTPAPAHAERNRPTPQARMPHELSPADSLVPMVTQRADVPHLTTAHAERPRAAVCVRSICHTRNLRRAGRPEPRLGHRHPRHGQLAGWVSAGLNVFGGGLGCAGACS